LVQRSPIYEEWKERNGRNAKKADAESAFAQIDVTAGDLPVSRYVTARGYAALGGREKDMDELERASEDHNRLMIVIGTDQIFAGIREEPRFRALIEKLHH
jgi:hypothetical protein